MSVVIGFNDVTNCLQLYLIVQDGSGSVSGASSLYYFTLRHGRKTKNSIMENAFCISMEMPFWLVIQHDLF